MGGLSFKILSGGGCGDDESDGSDAGKVVEDGDEGEEERGRLSDILSHSPSPLYEPSCAE